MKSKTNKSDPYSDNHDNTFTKVQTCVGRSQTKTITLLAQIIASSAIGLKGDGVTISAKSRNMSYKVLAS